MYGIEPLKFVKFEPGELADGAEFMRATREAAARNAPPEEHDQLLKVYRAKVFARWAARSKLLKVDDDVLLSGPESDDPYDTAIAAVLRARKAELKPRVTFKSLEASTGIKVRRLKYLINGEHPIHMGDFVRLTTALDLDPAAVIQAATDRVENTAA